MENSDPPFGRFTREDREYEIFDAEAPPRHQINFLWNETLISGHNQFGNGEGVFNDHCMLLNHPEGRVRLVSKGRRFFYLLDRGSGKFWSAGWFPAPPETGTFQTRVGLGYSVYEIEAEGIRCSATAYLAPDEPAEIWEFEISNTGKCARELWLVPYVEWGLGGYPTFSSPFSYLRGTYDKKLKAALSWNTSDERPHPRYNAFVATDASVEQWAASPRDFFGPYGSPARPKALLEGSLPCREAWCETLAGVLAIPLELAPRETASPAVLLGSFDTQKEAARMIRKIFPQAYRTAAKEQLRAEKDAMISTSMVETPDPAINRLTNIWAKQQIQLCAEFGRDGARGFRDTLQDAWGILPFNPGLARGKIIETLSHQYRSGQAVRGWMPLQPHNYSDGPTWITPTVVAYLKETGDFAFLDEPAPYLDGGSGSVLEHMIRSARHLSEDTGSHGLVLAHDGDWNDSLNWMGVGGKGESVWTSMALFHGCNLLGDLATRILADRPLAEEMAARAAKIEAAINGHGWDGLWYLAGYSDSGTPVGSHQNQEGRIFLNTQTWAILAGLARGDRKEACLRAIDTALESAHGSLTLAPAYTAEDRNVGRVTVLLPGMYENGTPYCHGTAFKIVADCIAGRGNEALRSYRKVMPDNPGHPSARSGCEPYAFTNQYLGPQNGRAGESISGWITGTAGWMYRAVLEYMIGIQPDYDGFRINPCLPDAWEEVSAKRTLRGHRYAISIRRTNGALTIFLDGKPLDDPFVPYRQ